MDELKMQNGALILEGGSLRSLFTSGVLDVFMEHNLYFSDVTGVSAGSLTGVNYVSRQPGRSAKLNIDYVNDKRYLGVNNLILHHEIFNFDFLFNDLSHSILPMDFDTFYKSPQRFTAVATNLRTGEAEYFEKSSCSDILTAIRASSSMPKTPIIISMGIMPCEKLAISCGRLDMNDAMYSTSTNFANSEGWKDSGMPIFEKSSQRFAPFRSTPQNTTATMSAIISMSASVLNLSSVW